MSTLMTGSPIELAGETSQGDNKIADLVADGRKKGRVSPQDLLRFFPEGELNITQVDQAFAALISAGVEVGEEAKQKEPARPREKARPIPGPREMSPEEALSIEQIETDDMVGLYLKQAATMPLLTSEEEVTLAKAIEQGRKARLMMAKGKVSVPQRNKWMEMVEQGSKALNRLILSNSRLVISIARKYNGRGVPFLDLIQEGNIGLMRATKKFDYQRGYKFSTYATWWIRQAITRAVADQGRTIRVPVHLGDQITRMRKVQNRLKQELSRDPTLEETAQALEVPIEKIHTLLRAARNPLSLEMPVDEDGETELEDFIEDNQAPAPEEMATEHFLQAHLKKVLETLPPREVRVLQLRYGLFDGDTLTLEEVGRKMGVTRERVRQIEAQALRRLRQPKIHQVLRDYLA